MSAYTLQTTVSGLAAKNADAALVYGEDDGSFAYIEQNGRLAIVDSTGALTARIPASWVGLASFGDMAAGPHSTLIVSGIDATTGTVTRMVTRNGDIVRTIAPSTARYATTNLTVDNAYTARHLLPGDNVVEAFDTNGTMVAQLGADSLGATFSPLDAIGCQARDRDGGLPVYAYASSLLPRACSACHGVSSICYRRFLVLYYSVWLCSVRRSALVAARQPLHQPPKEATTWRRGVVVEKSQLPRGNLWETHVGGLWPC